MSDLYLVRHGQASFGHENYDQLSELGYQQAHWLGEYFAERDIAFDRIITGDLSRQIQTAESIVSATNMDCQLETHAGFNEFDFKALLKIHLKQSPPRHEIDWSKPRQVYQHLRFTIKAWSEGELDSAAVPETWNDFTARIEDAVAFAQQYDQQKVLVVSSGGALSTALSQQMGFDVDSIINLNMQIKNTSVSHCFYEGDTSYVTHFNNVPHLDRPDRLASITYI